MTITCPQCGTRYRAPAGVEGETVPYRCTKCRTVFRADDPPVDAPDEGEPEFVFGDESGMPTDVPASRRRKTWRREEETPEMQGADPARFAVRLIVLVTLLYGVLSIYLYTHPGIIRATVGRIPLIGSGLTETRLSPQSVRISNIQGDYRRVLGDHLVFVISGDATNVTAAAVRGVQVQGRVVADEKEEQQTVFCGTPPPMLEDRTLQDILLFQKLHTPPDWSLAPGERTRFMIVFTAPSPQIKRMTAEVVAVQASRRHSEESKTPPSGQPS